MLGESYRESGTLVITLGDLIRLNRTEKSFMCEEKFGAYSKETLVVVDLGVCLSRLKESGTFGENVENLSKTIW